MKLAGKFVVFDGPDGCGKTSQLARLEAHLRAAGQEVARAKDPGGTEIGDRIRHILLGHDLSKMDPRCEALLFMASRAQLVAEVVRPALAAGRAVLGDRFISATCAYQAAAGFPRDDVLALGRLAVGDTWPDLTIVLDVPPEVGFERTRRTSRPRGKDHSSGQMAMFAGAQTDAMERRPLEFHRKVREYFRELPDRYPRPVVVIDATPPAEAVFVEVLRAIERSGVAACG